MVPSRQEAMEALREAEAMNPGQWVDHVINVGRAAEAIALHCPGMDGDKAYVLGLLHDIGRRVGVVSMKHGIAGYEYAVAKGWDEVAKICMTHSYPVKDIRKDIARIDVTVEEYQMIQQFLEETVYDEYDRLIILCDSLATSAGFCLLEKRFVDTTRRYGIFPFTVERWDATFDIKDYFEKKMGRSIYSVLPGIEKTVFL